MMAQRPGPIPLIYILGVGHSGTTLLDLLLGTHSRIESLGEAKKYYHYICDAAGRPEHRRVCACGAHVNDCPYWREIRTRLEADLGSHAIDMAISDQQAFARHNLALFREALRVSGKEVICDSSKSPGRLRALSAVEGVEVHVVHLIRDCRAVAYSNKQKGHGLLRKAWRWQTMNLRWYRGNECMAAGNHSYTLVRYEDLVSQPEIVLKNILRKLDLDFETGQLDFAAADHHNLGGNRMRKQKGSKAIAFDHGYLDQLSNSEWRLCTLLSAVGLKHFGYPWMRQVPQAISGSDG